ncbi:MAG: outer membrane beta-barrel protein [Betaproteobacteria bacterium]|nr:outer membrane beta-barrel protein [Betaproteobacteria bacterium]
MRKTLTSLLLVTALFPLSAFAQQPIGVYVAPRLGYGTLKGTFTGVAPGYEDEKIGSQSKGAAILGLAVGYDFKRQFSLPIRAELEYAYLGRASKTYYTDRGEYGGLQALKMTLGGSTLFANTYFDLHNDSAFTPYVSVGLGYSFVSAKGKFSFPEYSGVTVAQFKEKTSTNFAWNLGIGAAWKLTDNIALDMGYRYANLGKAKTGYLYDYYGASYNAWAKTNNVTSHQFLFGARFSF